MSNVLSHYVAGADGATPAADTGLSRDALLSSVKMMLKLESYQDVADLVAAHRDLADADVDVLMIEATAARRLERLDASFDALGKAARVAPNRPDALERMIMLCRPMRMKKEARELLGQHASSFPARADFRDKVTWV